jgi:hypothetical protein
VLWVSSEGNSLKREEAIAILQEIIVNQLLPVNWVSLVFRKSDLYEIHIKPESAVPESLKHFVEKHGLALKEGVNGVLIILREHEGSQ